MYKIIRRGYYKVNRVLQDVRVAQRYVIVTVMLLIFLIPK